MRLHTSNRAEHLVDQLAEVLRRPSGGPFEPEIVLVHSPGMEAWLSQRIAERIGICAHVEFPFPHRFIPDMFGRVLEAEADGSEEWTRSRIQWAIVGELSTRWDAPELTPVRRYLVDEGDGPDMLKTIQLASRIARIFIGYLYYRPTIIERWQRGEVTNPDDEAERWQALVWRGVRARIGTPNVVELFSRFMARLAEPAAPTSRSRRTPVDQLDLFGGSDSAVRAPVSGEAPAGLPSRVCLFGISSLPPLQLEIFGALARWIDVELFVLSPSREFFAEIRDPKAMARERARRRSMADVEDYLEVGNALLASLGRLGRDFQYLLYDETLPVTLHEEAFFDPTVPEKSPAQELQAEFLTDPPTALQVLQADILELRHRGHGSADSPDYVAPIALHPDDRTIAIHSCHSEMRQVEVLHDQLLALFAHPSKLSPPDVIVMCPDLETYGPLVEAVFARGTDDPRNIPFRIADRSLRRDSPVAEAFLALLRLVSGRLAAPEVMDLLSMPVVHRRFGIAADDLPRISEWLRATAVRWGFDDVHRAEHGQPPYEENTWRFGLDRMLLGAAMPGDGARMFEGVLPFDPIEGGAAQLVGRLTAFATALASWSRDLSGPRTLADWRADLGAAMAALLASDDETAWQHEQLRRLLDDVATDAEQAEVDTPIEFEVVRTLLTEALAEGRSSYGFLTGAVTFCEMLPMRAIPFKVVAMLGMDERAFPRSSSRLRFDLVGHATQRGDRSPRDDDRYLFLEALLSARDRVLITYTGQGVRDNATIPPSVVVTELLDACVESFLVEKDGVLIPAREKHFLTKHALQPFSERYFRTDDPLFTYAVEFFSGAESLRAPVESVRPFVTAPAPPPVDAADDGDIVLLDELIRFYRDPVRYFFQRRLGIVMPQEEESLLDREPVSLGGLERAKVADRMLERALAGQSAAESYAVVRAEGALPLGVPGRAAHEELAEQVEALEASVARLRGAGESAPVHVEVACDDVRVTGQVADVYDGRFVAYQYNRLRGDRELAFWVQHLALAASGAVTESALIGRPSSHSPEVQHGSRGLTPKVVRFRAPVDARRLLADLVEFYRAGLREPLLLFPRTGMVWWELDGQRSQFKSAAQSWEGSFASPHGERDQPYTRRLLGPDVAFSDLRAGRSRLRLGALPSVDALQFMELSRAVFLPLLDHRST